MASIAGTPASLAATFGLVARFLKDDDHSACRIASKAIDGLYRDCGRQLPACSARVRRQILDAITTHAHTLPKKVRWPSKVIAALANDLFLVVTGVRTGCLDLAGCDLIRAVYLDDDLFFVHAPILCRTLVKDLASCWASRLCIDVTPSSSSTAPTILSPPPLTLAAFASTLVTALTWSTSPHRVFALTPLLQRCLSPSPIAIAGLLLDYPVLYWHANPRAVRGNTLGLVPLVLYRVTLDVEGATLSVAQFSAPQALHRARVLRARCRRRTPSGQLLCVVSSPCVLASVSL
ncbi:hypothetical protein SPRG_05935 [Saprolegnia parasitica CBS 223.65]|uniref:Uncharacterized protein n=1 Tax=Saprolegnia parasitica (strain CBS 223.65) TaxID=695850 RepID=A0A067CFW6_SAPPC|nr:hypothetical protein SPRG_05935 [Saprolegnia parasitica CBS 223.65]KDO29398.1 hypothetical protein SPRG_05935 [Saprolegnia parasitica CBS 223.65]|eukprot:XP_012199900.1 hypothetical protein SPRG_05935 [Saprolegnia parasitica CBS 223.65]